MQVASLGLCKELYELSGFVGTEFAWWIEDKLDPKGEWKIQHIIHVPNQQYFYDWKIPAYTTGYLLRQLPAYTHVWITENGAEAECYFPKQPTATVHGDTPEDAACKLAIELIKQKAIQP